MLEDFIAKTDISIPSNIFSSAQPPWNFSVHGTNACAFLIHIPHLENLMSFDYPSVLLLLSELPAQILFNIMEKDCPTSTGVVGVYS